MARVPADATAFGHRSAQYCLVVETGWQEAGAADSHRGWATRLTAAMEPFTSGAAYLNDLGRASDEGRDAIRAAYGTNYARLAALKAKYDPTNLFSHNQNIEPAG
jgi:FAD/FMN-containing dehydrogenase